MIRTSGVAPLYRVAADVAVARRLYASGSPLVQVGDSVAGIMALAAAPASASN